MLNVGCSGILITFGGLSFFYSCFFSTAGRIRVVPHCSFGNLITSDRLFVFLLPLVSLSCQQMQSQQNNNNVNRRLISCLLTFRNLITVDRLFFFLLSIVFSEKFNYDSMTLCTVPWEMLLHLFIFILSLFMFFQRTVKWSCHTALVAD